MASKTWTSQADWTDEWTWTNADLTTTPGSVRVAAGQTEAVGVSDPYEASNWATGQWTRFKVAGTAPAGTTYFFRFRTATTSGGLATATYTSYQNMKDVNGYIEFDLAVFCLNNPAWDVGPWIQYELTLRTD